MSGLEILVKAWDEAAWEFSLAFEGLKDADVWRRAHPSLLSIGELAGHTAFYEAYTAVGAWGDDGVDIELPIESQLVAREFRYYTITAANEIKLKLGSEDVASELKRIHEEARDAVLALNPGLDDGLRFSEKVSWQMFLNYRIFHIAYHAGQAYSVRHLLGDTPQDN